MKNSQLTVFPFSRGQRGRSCFLREANSDAELDERIYQMGDFGRIMNIAKRLIPSPFWSNTASD